MTLMDPALFAELIDSLDTPDPAPALRRAAQAACPNSDAEQRSIWSTLEGAMRDDFDEPLDDHS